jgi:5-methylcytosine-specific restriction protein A
LADDLEDEVQEGRILYRLHRSRERNQAVVARKKASVLKAGHALACEAFGLIFGATYGALGGDYIEVHHRVPLHVSGPTQTRLSDLSLVCANCHRMIHQSRPWLTVEDLAALVNASRS